VKLILVQVQNAPHEAKLSHELIAAAASYEVRGLMMMMMMMIHWSLTQLTRCVNPTQAAKAYNDHCDREGQPQSHEKAKEIL